ncbi:hypothetical protein EDD15DRAFT_2198248, partial [Pisolithus albus]
MAFNDKSAAISTNEDIQMDTSPVEQASVPVVEMPTASTAEGLDSVIETIIPKDLPATHNDEDMATDEGVAKDKGKAKQVIVSDEEETPKGGEKKNSKAKGQQRKPRISKVVSAVRDLPTEPIQEFVDRINSHVARATLGYGLMTVMDNNDLGRGPQVERQQVNLRNVDSKFMTAFIQGVKDHGLRNRYIENALDIGIDRNVVDIGSLRGGQSLMEAYTNNVRWLEGAPKTKAVLYNGNHRLTYMQEHSPFVHTYNQRKLASANLATRRSLIMRVPSQDAFSQADNIIKENGVWLVRFLDLDFIQRHEDRPFIETTLAGNQLLPTHTDSENDSFNTMMNVLLQMPSADSRHKYIDTTLATV